MLSVVRLQSFPFGKTTSGSWQAASKFLHSSDSVKLAALPLIVKVPSGTDCRLSDSNEARVNSPEIVSDLCASCV